MFSSPNGSVNVRMPRSADVFAYTGVSARSGTSADCLCGSRRSVAFSCASLLREPRIAHNANIDARAGRTTKAQQAFDGNRATASPPAAMTRCITPMIVHHKPISPNNVLRRSIFPACEALELPHATWLTFRRTYSSWSHDKGVPGKVVAQLMGHANVDTTLNVYTQVLDGSLRAAVEKVGDELFTIVHQPEEGGSLSH